jgi:hypothetical protein
VVTWLYADHGADRHYLNAPLLHVNPKGWTDSYRFPKLTYYLWQANYTSEPMVFIHPTWWRPRHLGQRRDIRVDSNCDEVELKLDGVSLGKRAPTDGNAHSVVFENVEVRRGTLVAEGRKDGARSTTALPLAGEPARLVLACSQEEISADRAGIAVVQLDIVDADGAHVFGANPPLTWSVAGPARLIGPPRYETDTAKNGAREGTMYIDAPVANLVRSTATPGEIRVRVSAPGLAPAELTLRSVAPAHDQVAGIGEPGLNDRGRAPVARDPDFMAVILGAKFRPLSDIYKDFDFTGATLDECRTQLEAFIRKRNPNADVLTAEFTAEYRAFIERIAALVLERGGHLVADDYNFNVRALNESAAATKK